jgi:hypothetical protein
MVCECLTRRYFPPLIPTTTQSSNVIRYCFLCVGVDVLAGGGRGPACSGGLWISSRSPTYGLDGHAAIIGTDAIITNTRWGRWQHLSTKSFHLAHVVPVTAPTGSPCLHIAHARRHCVARYSVCQFSGQSQQFTNGHIGGPDTDQNTRDFVGRLGY